MLACCAQVHAFNCSEVEDIPELECVTLMNLYDSLNVASSSLDERIKIPWGSATTTSVCDVNFIDAQGNDYGFKCFNNRLSHIILANAGLEGVINLKNIDELFFLHLANNNLTGSIPSNLSDLEWLYLNGNNLSGVIPNNLDNVIRLNLDGNNLSGVIPNNLDNVVFLSLRDNNLSGVIPNNLDNVQYLYLYDNNFTGAVPDYSQSIFSSNVSIANNCISPAPETPQSVINWLESANTGINDQRTRANCFENNDLIARNGLETTFGGKELIGVLGEDFEDGNGSVFVDVTGRYLVFDNVNSWKAVPYPYVVTENTTLRFRFLSVTGAMAGINGVGLTRDIEGLLPIPPDQGFQIFGSEVWDVNQEVVYGGDGSTQQYCIEVGSYFTGPTDYLVFVNDNDNGVTIGQKSIFSNYELSETPCP